jgi:hypothetical protein
MPTDTGLRPDTGDWPEEFFLEGPVPDGADLLRRTVADVHRHSARSARLRGALLMVALVIAGVVLTGAGMAIGRATHGLPAFRSPITAVDTRTGARLTASIGPADGGSAIALRVTGLPAGTDCRLTVVGRGGVRVDDGGWRTGPDPMHMTVWLPPDQVTGIDVATDTGTELNAEVG